MVWPMSERERASDTSHPTHHESTYAELDDDTLLTTPKKGRDTRIIRIARGSGRSLREVNELLDQFKHFQKIMKKMKGLKVGKGGNIAPRNMNQISSMLPAGLVKQMGGTSCAITAAPPPPPPTPSPTNSAQCNSTTPTTQQA